MKSTLLRRTVLTVLALAVPIAALANLINQTKVLSANTALSLDTGATSGSGGDVLWNGTTINAQGSAKVASLSTFGSGMSGYATVQEVLSIEPASALSSFVTLTTSLPASALTVNSLFAVLTNGGNAAVVLVTANSGGSLTIEFSTYGSGVASTGPTITGVLNNYSYIPSGFVNSGVSPSTIAYVSGTNMSAAPIGTLTLNSSAAPGLPTTSAGATYTIAAGGKNYPAPIYYASPTQSAIVIPAAVPVGTATLTVSYNNATSTAFQFQVVPQALGLDSYYGTGSGLITATNAITGALFNYTNSASPNQIVVFWGSGSGANPQDSDTVFTNTPHPVNQSNTLFYIGDQQATVLYAGSSGYPGVNQYNVQLPANSQTGCNVSVAGVVNGVPSNFGVLPIAQGGGVCQDPALGVNGTQLSTEVTQTNYSAGTVELFQSTSPATSGTGTTTTQLALGNFEQFTGSVTVSGSGFVSLGSCIVTETVIVTGTVTETGLNAGNITVTGPAGSVPLVSEASLFPSVPSFAGFYATINAQGASTLPAGFIPATGGTFTFQGTGGTTAPSVGPFTTQIVFPNPPFQWTNQAAAATVTRSAGQLITWSGGSPGTYVAMSGSSSNGTISGSFTCLAPQSALQFIIPDFVLDTLPASTTISGNLAVVNTTVPVSFTATGITYGTAIGAVSYSINNTYK